MNSPGRQRTGKSSFFFTMLTSLSFLAPVYSLATDSVSKAVTIEMGDYNFSPNTIEIRAGRTVQLRLTNTDAVVPHNFTLLDATSGLEIDINIAAGETRSLELPQLAAGRYTYYCNKKLPFMKSHRKRGMEGTLIVNPASLE